VHTRTCPYAGGQPIRLKLYFSAKKPEAGKRGVKVPTKVYDRGGSPLRGRGKDSPLGDFSKGGSPEITRKGEPRPRAPSGETTKSR